MIYYPIIIPTLNRYEHFKRCVESLAKNTHADKTELVIGLDFPPSKKYFEGYEKIKNYIYTITGFAKVTIFEREHNFGPRKNLAALREYAFHNYDAVISTEDDNEFSPCFIDFMDKILLAYKDSEKYTSVSGYLHPNYEGISTQKVLLTKETNAWGMGLWRIKEEKFNKDKQYINILHSFSLSWKCFRTYPACFGMFMEMMRRGLQWGDVIRTVTNILNNSYQIRPSASLCKNWGNDGSGLHCSEDASMFFANQTISSEFTYDIGKESPIIEKKVLRISKKLLLPHSSFKRIKFLFRIIVKYVLFHVKCILK